MVNYADGKIYTIRCRNDASLVYVGSTTQKLSSRWGDHKSNWKCKRNPYSFYKLITDINDWYIELHEEYPCENNEQLHKREHEVMREISTLNRHIEMIRDDNGIWTIVKLKNPTKL
jgi:hypothetical protein